MQLKFCQEKLKVKEITQKEMWENFLLDCQEKTFLNSWNWGEFNNMMGSKIWRLGIFENSKLVNLILTIKIEAKRGTFLFIPHLISDKYLQILVNYLKERAREEKADFIRIAPILKRNEENIKVFKDLGFREAPIHMHPEASWKLDIKPSEEELLMNMRKTTRYLIRQAQKNKDIEIFQSKKIEDIEIFNRIYQEVVRSQHFVPFSLDYLRKEFLAFQPDNQISLFFGKYKGEIVASGFVLFWSNIGFYHHAALSPKYHKIPAAHLLQWEALKEAKGRGCVLYDFWGYVDPKSKHPWAGPTLFKMGFGGYKKEYVKTQDLPLSPKYWLNWVIEKIRKTKRGL